MLFFSQMTFFIWKVCDYDKYSCMKKMQKDSLVNEVFKLHRFAEAENRRVTLR